MKLAQLKLFALLMGLIIILLASAKSTLSLLDELSDAAVSSFVIEKISKAPSSGIHTRLMTLAGPDAFNWAAPAIALLDSLDIPNEDYSVGELLSIAYAASSEYVSYHLSRLISLHPGFPPEVQEQARNCIALLNEERNWQHLSSVGLLDLLSLINFSQVGRCS